MITILLMITMMETMMMEKTVMMLEIMSVCCDRHHHTFNSQFFSAGSSLRCYSELASETNPSQVLEFSLPAEEEMFDNLS